MNKRVLLPVLVGLLLSVLFAQIGEADLLAYFKA